MFINLHLIRFARGAEKKLTALTLLNMVVVFSASAVMLLTAILVDEMINSTFGFENFLWIYAGIAFCLILSFSVYRARTVCAEKSAVHIKDNVRSKLLQKMFALGPAYTACERTGEIATTLTSKVESLKFYYANYLPVAIVAIINALIFIAALWTVDGTAALVALLSCICMLVAPMCFYHMMKGLGSDEWAERARYYSDCLDGIQGISTLKALNANKRHIDRIAKQGEKLRKAVMAHLKVTMTEGSLLELFARGGTAATIVVIAFRHVLGAIPSDTTIFAYFFATACFSPMVGLINAWHLGFQGVSSSYSIVDMLYKDNERIPVDKLLDKQGFERSLLDDEMLNGNNTEITGDIAFSGVSFSYTLKDGEVLHNVSFTIKEGTMTALVGPSGSGKSTVAHLLAGFYPISSGSLTVGAVPVTEDNGDVLRNGISAVWQDCHLFYGTVYDNILIGNPKASEDEVYKAAREANLHEFICSLPQGYDTVTGERGMRFSGGERQRIAITRAYLRNKPILIFDEATSALDRKNEKEIQESFYRLSHRKTSLVIAHRMSTIVNADQICVLQKGRIIAVGSHEELENSSDAYRSLMGEQLKANKECSQNIAEDRNG